MTQQERDGVAPVPWSTEFGNLRFRVVPDYDDGTSLTAGIQEAIDALPVEGGVVYFPAGTYTIAAPAVQNGNTIELPSNVVLMGAGEGLVTIDLEATYDGHVMWNKHRARGNSHITIRDIRFNLSNIADAVNPTIGVKNACIIFGGDMEDILIERCTFFDNQGYGDIEFYDMVATGCRRVKILNCTLIDGKRGILIDTTADMEDAVIRGCMADGMQKGLVNARIDRNGIVSDNIVRDCGEIGIAVQGIENLTVSGNTALRCTSHGISVNVSDTVTVTGNASSYNGGDGIRVTGHDSTITGNTGADNTGCGIWVTGDRDFAISGNEFEDCGGDGIRLGAEDGSFQCRRSSLVGNVITNCHHGIAIYARDGTNQAEFTITGNRLTQNNYNGIHIGNDATSTGTLDQVIIMGNVCSNEDVIRQDYGIYIEDNVDDVIIIGNSLREPQVEPMRVPAGRKIEISHNSTHM